MKLTRKTLDAPTGPLHYRVIHRQRVTRRLHLDLDDEGRLLVVVPRDWPDFYTRRLLKKNLPMVQRFLARAQAKQLRPLGYETGAQHLFAGRVVTLRLNPTARSKPVIHLAGDQLHVCAAKPGPDRIKSLLRSWYRDQAQLKFPLRLERLANQAPWTKRRELKLALRRMTRTWGTCNSRGVIRLNTHLIKAPEACLDYVIAHELCHLAEMNHGPQFYALQQDLWPPWREHRQHLRDHGHRYTQE